MIILENVSKQFGTGSSALSDISLTIDKGEFVFLVGPSGAGKTTLLRLMIRDMVPTSGTILVNDMDVVALPNNKIPELRRKIGVVFQDLKLLMDRTIFENIALPLEMTLGDKHDIHHKVHQILEQVGIADHKDKFPVQLSGGELQRVAIARALVFSPDILLADEPTGNLDTGTSWEIVKLLQDINKTGTTIVMATHNTDIVNNLLKRVVTIEKGKVTKDERKDSKASKGSEESKDKEEIKENATKGTKAASSGDAESGPASQSSLPKARFANGDSEASEPKEPEEKEKELKNEEKHKEDTVLFEEKKENVKEEKKKIHHSKDKS